MNGDGIDDIICAAGPGGGSDIRIFDGQDGHMIADFMAYDAGFTGGVYVAAGDVNGDGQADIITGAGAGGGPHVRIFDGATGNVLDEFMAYGDGFSGGVRVAAADVDGDGLADVITGAGPGGGPHVQVFDERPLLNAPIYYGVGATRVQLFSQFAFDAHYTGGVFVAGGDVNGDGKAELIVSEGIGVNAEVRVLNALDGSVLADTVPFNDQFINGIRVAVTDPHSNGRSEVLVGAGPGSTTVQTLSGATLAEQGEFTAYDPGFLGGVFVG